MSWNFTVPKTSKAEFDAAVDALEAPQQDGKPINDKDFETAKTLLKYLATKTSATHVGGNASGHDLRDGENIYGMYNGMGASITSYTEN